MRVDREREGFVFGVQAAITLCSMTHVADPSMHAQTLARLSYILGAVLSSIQLLTMNKALSKSNASRYMRQLSGVNLDVFDLPYQHVRRHR